MNKQKGNMYGFVTHTWNPIKGKCSHDCPYCYMKVWKQKKIRIVECELSDNLGSGNFIFVGSSTDMFAGDIPHIWIYSVLSRCMKFDNNYLFQTKNPKKMAHFIKYFPKKSVLGITLETNRDTALGNAPYRMDRVRDFALIEWKHKMVSIEPLMDYDMIPFGYWLKDLEPEFVSIGADSKGHKLPEPTEEHTQFLINELSKFTQVYLKDNLKRLGDFTFTPLPKSSGNLIHVTQLHSEPPLRSRQMKNPATPSVH